MRIQVLVVLSLATCLLGAKLPYSSTSGEDSATQVLSRSVSVKTPERKSSVISHFLPADHRYEATGSVNIRKDPPSARPAPPAAVSAPAAKAPAAPARKSPASIARTVSVKTPERVSSVISHFTPADHRYEATGSVLINTGSSAPARSLPAPVPAPAAPRFVASPPPAPVAPSSSPAAKLSLSRTVSVKTPVRASNVISHFTPADHRYEATGSVVINQSSGSSRASSSAARVQKVAPPAPAPVRPAPAPVQPAPARTVSAATSSASKLALSRTVSVKTPERVSSVISHFTPADHRYEATGSVVINQASGSSQATRTSSAARVQKVAAPAPAPVQPAPARPVPAPAPAPARAAAASASKLSLSRTVSVKTPERASNVISHFTPADHRYEATGSVVINQASGSSQATRTSSAARVQKVAAPAPAPVQPAPARRAPAPAPAQAASTAASGASKLSLTRTVSVKTPERVSGVISHFTPADHRYEATGSVVINQASGSSRATKTSSSAARVQKVAAPAPAPVQPAPARPAPAPAPAPARAAAASASNLALSRTVSVKTPERVSNVISHFTPADHRYEATGSVVINQASGSSQARRISSPPAVRVQKVVVTPAPAPAPAPVRSAPISVPAPVRSIPAVAPSDSKLSLTRTISVKTPDRKSSVISHFTPADHRYEASGSVTINKSSVGATRTVTPSVRVVPSAPVAPAPARPAPAAASPKPAAASLTRTISVKTPERKSNVISFFTPADHSYDATGSVTINKSS